MPKAIWSGSISFGLVNVPVKLYTAVSPKDVRFHQLHDADGVRIEYRRVCPADGQEVPYEHIVKGYEIEPGRHVVVTPEELAALDPEATRTIDIEDFVDATDIDPVYFAHPYCLVPDRAGSEKAYALLHETMRRTGKVGIGRFVMRAREHLAVIRPLDGALVISTMHWPDEVVAPQALPDLPGPDVELTGRELAMAEQLVESLATKFDPERYHDHYRDQVLDLIERKAAGQEVAVSPAAPPRPGVVDLVAALEASLSDVESRRERQ